MSAEPPFHLYERSAQQMFGLPNRLKFRDPAYRRKEMLSIFSGATYVAVSRLFQEISPPRSVDFYMPTYNALFYDMNRLLKWEAIDAPDDMAALSAVPPCKNAAKIEIWRENVRLAIIRCAEERAGYKEFH